MQRSRRGTTAVEFALGLPFLAALVFGSMELCWFFHQQLAVVEAAADGARVASVTSSEDNIEAAAEDAVKESLEEAMMDASVAVITVVEDTDTLGDAQVTITVDYPFAPLFDYTPAPDKAYAVAVARLADQ